jgi:hypothetical protein
LPLLSRRLRLVLWRHLAIAQLFEHVQPRLRIFFRLVEGGEMLQIDVALLLLRGVTFQAILRKDRPDFLLEINGCGVAREWDKREGDEESQS